MSFPKNLFTGRRWIIGIAALVGVPLLATIVQSYGGSKRVVTTHTEKPALATPTDQVNLIDDTQFFVQQQYRDFLNREPDASGLAFWTNEITSCGSNTQCVEVKRINVSAAFFLSIEFQNSGYLVYRTYKAAFGNLPNKPVPVTREDMLPDMQEIGNGIIVNQGNWEQQLELNKQAYFNEFVTREQFVTLYPMTITPEQFVDGLNANAGMVLSQTERDGLVSDLKASVKSRAQVLRAVAEDADLVKGEFNKAFVLMQYFGYLRRDPDSAPDKDFSGFTFWLGKLNEFGGNYIQAEMVKAFLDSNEYRNRFDTSDWLQFNDATQGLSFGYPPSFEIGQRPSERGNEMIAINRSSPEEPPHYAIQVFSFNSTASPDVAVREVANARLGSESIISITQVQSGILVEAETLSGYHYFQFNATSRRAIELYGADRNFFMSAEFALLIQSLRF
jgi:hypothetical protein